MITGRIRETYECIVGHSRCSRSYFFNLVFLLWTSLTGVTPKLSTLSLYPTSERANERRRRSLQQVNETHRLLKRNRNSAVYASLSDEHEQGLGDAEQAFHQYRHLSRYERDYRERHGLDLQLDWNGTYSHHNERHLQEQEQIRLGGSYNQYQAVPLAQGYGTHYTHLWVGSPKAQRQSVIVDTGSHYTAFPCKGCDNCGEEHHTDPYYDPGMSVTFTPLSCSSCALGATCKDFRCAFTQSYTEGSSWEAYQVQDVLHLGGNDILASVDPSSQSYAIPFMFGCQTSENGLFVTQLADGIMGMSAHDMTITKQLYDQKKIQRKLFSLCFRRELATSRRGVTAGFMTVGGLDTKMDRSPMIFAKNTATSGWFTVYVKNIFIRVGGGQSATSKLEGDQHVLKIPLSLNAINSGKGVIVDSGTTDTYLHKRISKSFVSVWKQVTKKEYTHSGIILSDAQLRRLPTILVQCRAFDYRPDPSLGSPMDVIGFAGSLDPSSPNDLLIAIPAINYMEYSPTTNLYTSRLYFTETQGGVLGANAMQGHNVVFDWENGRVGFAESSCEYEDKHSAELLFDLDLDEEEKEKDNPNRNCQLKPPVLTKSCIQSMDTRICRQTDATKTVLQGTETWTYVVENPGSVSQGMSCEDATLLKSTYRGGLQTIDCDGAGLCTEKRKCEVSCTAFLEEDKILNEPSTQYCVSAFSACDFECIQTALSSVKKSDGNCHEISRSSRSCHTDLCGGNDSCRVPFLVQATFGFRGAKRDRWFPHTNEVLAVAIVNAVHWKLAEKRPYFDIGDIKSMLVSRWFDGPDPRSSSASEIGVKVVIQISLFNPNAKVMKDLAVPLYGNQTDITEAQSIASGTTMFGRPNLARTTCTENDLYPLAKSAHAVHNILEEAGFMQVLVGEMKKAEGGDMNFADSAFRDMYNKQELVAGSMVLASWTVRTEVDESYKLSMGIVPRRIRQYAFNWNFMVAFCCMSIFLVAWTYEFFSNGGGNRLMKRYSDQFNGMARNRHKNPSVQQRQTSEDERLFVKLFHPTSSAIRGSTESECILADTDGGDIELRTGRKAK
jgi:hypothetical protein